MTARDRCLENPTPENLAAAIEEWLRPPGLRDSAEMRAREKLLREAILWRRDIDSGAIDFWGSSESALDALERGLRAMPPESPQRYLGRLKEVDRLLCDDDQASDVP